MIEAVRARELAIRGLPVEELQVAVEGYQPITGHLTWQNVTLPEGTAVNCVILFGEQVGEEFTFYTFMVDTVEYIWGSIVGDTTPAPGESKTTDITSYAYNPAEEITPDVLAVVRSLVEEVPPDALYSVDWGYGSRALGLKRSWVEEMILPEVYGQAVFVDVCTVTPGAMIKITDFTLEVV